MGKTKRDYLNEKILMLHETDVPWYNVEEELTPIQVPSTKRLKAKREVKQGVLSRKEFAALRAFSKHEGLSYEGLKKLTSHIESLKINEKPYDTTEDSIKNFWRKINTPREPRIFTD